LPKLIGGVQGGLNSFEPFSVASGHTVNLYLPEGASHLINLVHSSRSEIHGVLNSIKDNAIGGNVYFLNPHGIVVGEEGVINVGSIVLSTPTSSFMNSFFSGGQLSDAAVQAVLDGEIPVTPSGLSRVDGSINALRDITIQGGNIEIGSTGTIITGSAFVWDDE